MTNVSNTAANVNRRQQAEFAWGELLREALRRGFHGTVAVEAIIQDGTIQHIRRRTERVEK